MDFNTPPQSPSHQIGQSNVAQSNPDKKLPNYYASLFELSNYRQNIVKDARNIQMYLQSIRQTEKSIRSIVDSKVNQPLRSINTFIEKNIEMLININTLQCSTMNHELINIINSRVQEIKNRTYSVLNTNFTSEISSLISLLIHDINTSQDASKETPKFNSVQKEEQEISYDFMQNNLYEYIMSKNTSNITSSIDLLKLTQFKLKGIDLQSNPILPEQFARLLIAIEKSRYYDFILSKITLFQPQWIDVIKAISKNPHIHTIVLKKIAFLSMKDWEAVLLNPIELFVLNGCAIKNVESDLLYLIKKNSVSLKILGIINCKLDDKCATSLCSAISENSNLKSIVFTQNSFSIQAANQITELCRLKGIAVEF